MLISPCDCRILVYDSAHELESITFKGQHFSWRQLLGDDGLVEQWAERDTALALLRLVPTDYHRFHVPCPCEVIHYSAHGESMLSIHWSASLAGHTLLHENERVTVRLRILVSELSEAVLMAIGAVVAGSVNITAHVRKPLDKGDELGFFAFGGSTIVVAFERGSMQWDSDLLERSSQRIETRLLMGDRIGRLFGQEKSQAG